jgi:sugar/nucleoside kinase (ribokinase family)
MSVVVVGDLNVDMEIVLPKPGGVTPHGNPPPRLLGGGSAANTAAALATLGVPCRFVGTVGEDGYGRLAVAGLAEAGVDTSAITETAESPTVMVVVVVQPTGERLIYVWPPTGGAHGWLGSADAVAGAAGADWLHVSGICLRVQPARDALLAAMTAARAAGVPVSFDLNLRLENWGWDDDFRSVVTAAVEQADIVVGSAVDEVCALAGIEDPVEAALALAGDHRLVVARVGPDGSRGCSADGVLRVPGFPVDVADTVGAGDAFNAGFISARLSGYGTAEALRWGNAVAALSIMHPGARGTPTLAETTALLGH